MKTKLFTKNVYLGLLMALVLVLGVQGIADAITKFTRETGDLQTVQTRDEFTVSFTVTLQSPQRMAGFKSVPSTDESDPGVSVPAAERTNMFYDDDPDIEYIHGTTARVPYAEAHYYDQERVTIAASNANILKVGSTLVPASDASGFTMHERSDPTYEDIPAHRKLSSGRITLRLSTNTANTVSITLSDGSEDSDVRSGKIDAVVSTVYVVQPQLSVTGQATTFTSNNGGVEYASDRDILINATDNGTGSYFTFAADDAPVYYSVEGSGRVYVKVNGRQTSSSNRLRTSSEAPVYLDPNNGTSKVTAFIAGNTGKTAIFIFQGPTPDKYPEIEITQGNNQTGATEARLEKSLKVRVTDGNNRPVSGVAVGFASTDPGTPDNASMFIPVPGTVVYRSGSELATTLGTDRNAIPLVNNTDDTTIATLFKPSAGAAIFVQTDRNGVAETYFQLSDGVTTDTPPIRPHRVTATLQGLSLTTRFDADAVDVVAGDAAKIEIESGNGQRADVDEPLEDPLVVIVKDIGGRIVAGAPVTFTTSSGGLSAPAFSDPGTYTTSDAHSDRFIVVDTDRNGRASVRYNVGDLPGAKEVFAGITRSGRAITKTFNINGGSSGGGDGRDDTRNEEPTTPNRLSISLSGSGDTRTVQVSALQAGTTSTSGIFTTLTTNGGTLSPTSGATPLTSTWTLPSGAGTYTVTATTAAGYTSASESVTVTVPGTLTARQDGGTIVVSASPAPTSNLAFRLTTSGGGYAGQGEILTTGSGRAIPILTTGSHILTVNAEGYNATQVSFTPGTQTTTDTTTTTTTPTTPTTTTGTPGVADSLEIDGARTLEGTVNQATRLRVRVLDATNRGVSGIRVTFRVLAPGRGRLSQRGNGRAVIAETDRSGYASASVTPLGGNLIVEAKAAGVSASVSFIIDVDGSTTPRETSDTTDGRTYQVGDKVPISLEDTLTFRGSRTLNGTSYTCVGSGECVVSYGTLVKGEITAAAVPKVQAKTYKTGEKIPISLTATLTFSGKHTLGGTVYTCVSDGECVVSYGILTKGEIEVSTVSTPSASDSPGMSDAKAVVGAANRPVMYWIAGGGLYRLAGASAEQIAESATDVAVGSDKLYWIEQTSETRGAIHHANLDGSGAAVVKTLTSVPKGVALANGKLYITNGWGKIQRMNVDGTQFETNFLTNLGAPLGIAVSGSRVYWTDGSGRVRSAPLQGTKAIQNIVTGSGTLGGIVADGSKVYWTEQTGERSGRIRAANLDGTGITDAYTVTATVHGLALDPGNQQLYWTNGWGKVQRGVRGSRYQDVVTGLMTPTALAIGGANTATPMPATKPVQTAAEPNYDVDGSGTVDNADLFLVSLAVGTDNAQYDVNGDGTVDDKDIALVRDNRDNGAAAAPMVFGVKLTAEQVGRLQAQIDLLIVSGDRSPDALKTLVYLQQLIATARPEQTQLLANYPNPFNPETWIPYELATDTDVRITIYAANGVVVRTLQLGQQSAGYYTDRERAAYWDGRNASGEQVASGVYFYQLETDEISSLRKMVILK